MSTPPQVTPTAAISVLQNCMYLSDPKNCRVSSIAISRLRQFTLSYELTNDAQFRCPGDGWVGKEEGKGKREAFIAAFGGPLPSFLRRPNAFYFQGAKLKPLPSAISVVGTITPARYVTVTKSISALVLIGESELAVASSLFRGSSTVLT